MKKYEYKQILKETLIELKSKYSKEVVITYLKKDYNNTEILVNVNDVGYDIIKIEFDILDTRQDIKNWIKINVDYTLKRIYLHYITK